MRTACALALLCSGLLLSPALTSPAWAQPEGGPAALDGGQVVLTKCVDCHTLRPVFRANYDRDGWNDAFSRMIGEGLEINDAERWAAIDFLTQTVKVPDAERHGQPHFALVHFPIALVYAWALVELCGYWRRDPLASRYAALLLGWLTVLGAFAAMMTGFWLEHDRTTMPGEMVWHMYLGMAAFVITLAAAIVRLFAWRGKLWTSLYTVLLVLAMIVIGFAGHLGGLMVHGEVLQAWLPGS